MSNRSAFARSLGRRSPTTLFILTLALLMLAADGWGQNTTSSIFGTITDPTGAVIPGARVTATNTETGVQYPTATSGAGAYRITQLPPGTYTLEVSGKGFANKRSTPFTLVVDEQSQQNISLETGTATQTVSVSAASLLLNTQSSSEGQVIQNQQIVQLPLNGRDYMQLTALSPGVTPVVSGISTPASAWTGTQAVSVDIAGTREDDVSYLYDGIETRNAWYGAEGLLPSVDNIQEFKVDAIGAPASYGDGASFVNVITRSGTNSLHGTAYEFLRNNDFDDRNYFDIGAPPPFHQNQFGASIGGPIIKNKLFYFFNYEGFRQISPADEYNLVPTAAERSGNFSALSAQLVNPSNGAPFAGNMIPSTDFNSIGQKILAYYPLPNGSYAGGDNYFNVADTIDNWNQESGRIDYTPTAKDSFFARVTLQSQSDTVGGITPYVAVIYPSDPKSVAGGWTHTYSANLVNTLRIGWNHTSTGENRPFAYDANFANPLGLANEEDQSGSYGPPAFGVTGYANPGSDEGTDLVREGLMMGTDNLLLQRGKHELEVGLDLRYEPMYMYEDWAATSIDFNGAYSGNAISDLLLGVPDYSQTAIGNPTLNFRSWYQAYYVQDNWRAKRRLTINAGLRWEHHSQPVDVGNRVGTFDLATNQDLSYPQTNALGLGRNMVKPIWTNFAPRVGFNWAPYADGKTDVKGAFGIYFLQANMNQYEVEVDTTQYYLVEAYTNSPPGTRPLNFNLGQLFNTSLPGALPTASFINPHDPTPYTYE